MKLRLLSLYPDQMNIYADRGNILFLQHRCEWRGIEFEVTRCGPGQRFDPANYDLLYMGGGQDRDQKAVARDLIETKQASMRAAKDGGVAVLAVCGGYQLLGESYELEGETIAGLGLVDLKTIREPGPRLIGPVSISVNLDGEEKVLAGFENHGGRTRLGQASPLGKVIHGHGNNGEDGFEGVREDNLIGTYLHGPLLPKNAWLADHLIATGLEHHHGERPELEPLEDSLETAAHEAALKAARKG
ncbi:MAG TPA: glutamine amidotransferase [Solirubrobacterales bacterium]|jgi:CobQ-like glutamine amidotransferase family enzyme|nr:glutamine amidotransferase [Solirubrobacterales bacterium]HMX71070.1 glutamine amidotransferase [Solirubrobacterales bacterium]HMY24708.1 glutamine amidotransferase [Solirubrobacterales bacterium]HNA23020.1 glutamine amidotransferase [Solirubrobacterales bacterium]HNA43379.1 glutamine amidotransferase [Solirubrobacterales bacterium]